MPFCHTLSKAHAIITLHHVFLSEVVCARFLHACHLCLPLLYFLKILRGYALEEKLQGHLHVLLVLLSYFRGGLLSGII